MTAITAHTGIGELGWTLPIVVVVLMIAGAIGGLLAGLPPPDLIAADGAASLFLPVP